MTFRHHRAFEPRAESVGEARRFVGGAVASVEGLDPSEAERIAEVAELLTSELASNAVLHAQTPFAVEIEPDAGSADGPELVISVVDQSPALPVLRTPTADALGGRGIFLVDRLAVSWGVERVPGGKRVWCRLGPEVTYLQSTG